MSPRSLVAELGFDPWFSGFRPAHLPVVKRKMRDMHRNRMLEEDAETRSSYIPSLVASLIIAIKDRSIVFSELDARNGNCILGLVFLAILVWIIP